MSKLDILIRRINDSGYEDGENGAGHPASIDEWKNDFKDIIQQMFDQHFPSNDKLIYRFWKEIEKL
jgi:hypothetical protein